jgi:hypothetical protein
MGRGREEEREAGREGKDWIEGGREGGRARSLKEGGWKKG